MKWACVALVTLMSCAVDIDSQENASHQAGVGERAPWPMWRGDLRHTGVQSLPGAMSPPTLRFTLDVGQGESTPVVANLDEDEPYEIVNFLYGGALFALDNTADGGYQELWRKQLTTTDTGITVEISSPTIADLDLDGEIDIVVGSHIDGRLFARRASDGSELWTTEWMGQRIMGTPVVADVTGSGAGPMTVIVSSLGGEVFGFDGATGTQLWRVLTGNAHGAAALADLDGDGDLEMVLGSTWSFGVVVMQFIPGEPPVTSMLMPVAGSITSTPAIGDINGDDAYDIVVAVESSGVYAFSGSLGQQLWFTPWGNTSIGWMNSPALGNLDEDPALEVVAGNGQPDFTIHVFDGTTGAVEGRFSPDGDDKPDLEPSATIGDFDGDGRNEFLYRVYDTFMYLLELRDGNLVEKWRYGFAGMSQSGDVACSPVLVDLDADGESELLIQESTEKIYIFDSP